jgi:hypothetical protein
VRHGPTRGRRGRGGGERRGRGARQGSHKERLPLGHRRGALTDDPRPGNMSHVLFSRASRSPGSGTGPPGRRLCLRVVHSPLLGASGTVGPSRPWGSPRGRPRAWASGAEGSWRGAGQRIVPGPSRRPARRSRTARERLANGSRPPLNRASWSSNARHQMRSFAGDGTQNRAARITTARQGTASRWNTAC